MECHAAGLLHIFWVIRLYFWIWAVICKDKPKRSDKIVFP